MLTKKWYQSKTVILNVLATMLSLLGFITPDLLAAVGLNPEKFMAIVGAVTAIINVILRAGGQPTVISTAPAGSYVHEKR